MCIKDRLGCSGPATGPSLCANFVRLDLGEQRTSAVATRLLYTPDAADDLPCVDLGGRRIIKKKNNTIRR